MTEPRTHTLREAAELCGLTLTAMRKRADRGAMRTVLLDGVRRVPASELERLGLLPGTRERELVQRIHELERELAGRRLLERELETERVAYNALAGSHAEQRARAQELEARERELATAGPLRTVRLLRARRRDHAAAA